MGEGVRTPERVRPWVWPLCTRICCRIHVNADGPACMRTPGCVHALRACGPVTMPLPLTLTLWPPEGAEVPVDGRISWEADLSVALRHSQSE